MSPVSGAPGRVASARRLRVRVEGTVQGVGFRPFVHRLAHEHGLGGWVLNDERGVLLEVEGDPDALERFLADLAGRSPPLAVVERIGHEPVAPLGEAGFTILASAATGPATAPVTPDTATCEDCLRELRDPSDRRFRYPFINCTNCGPRFTIVRGVPYDRPLTTMAGFAMCERCRAEYEDPGDRRFHAQPNACPACGPSVRLLDRDGAAVSLAGAPACGPSVRVLDRDAAPLSLAGVPACGPSVRVLDRDAAPLSLAGVPDAVAAAAALLRAGRVVAVKGIGGFHLAVRADDDAAVARLRARKHREDRPFALLAADVAAARALVELGEAEEALLTGRERPIVLAARRPDAAAADAVAPLARELGVMLPYSPLHHLLADGAGVPLVLTSGNVSDEPIAYEDDDALARLAAIADAFLLHDRPIETRTDDSVVRAVAVGGVAGAGADRRPLVLRRSRGHVPASLPLPRAAPRPVLACGAELKSTFCLAKGARAWVGHHIGDLKNEATLRSYVTGIRHFERLFAVRPEVVAHDLHPQYLSTAYAQERDGVALLAVQHHHAHLAACLAEHGVEEPAVGAIYDGTGYGPDGTVWGGELLAGGLGGFERAGRLFGVRMPGGERAIHEPWRMACAWLAEAGGAGAAPPPGLAGAVEGERWRQVAELARTGLASPTTTSAGRLFDAVAALCGVRPVVTYEGQAAIELEALADPAERASYPLPVGQDVGGLVLDARVAVTAVAADVAGGVPAGVVAARFHNALARATAEACVAAAQAHGLGVIVLSGGVFQNRRLLEDTAARVASHGLRVLVPERLPPGDGGIAYGQAAIAAFRDAEGGGLEGGAG